MGFDSTKLVVLSLNSAQVIGKFGGEQLSARNSKHDPHITKLHQQLVNGSDSAALELDKIFRQRLCQLVDREMNVIFQRRVDPEDIVQSVLKSFYLRSAEDRFEIKDRNSIWGLLAKVTRNKLRKRIAKDLRQKRSLNQEIKDGDALVAQKASDDEAHAHLLAEALERALGNANSPTLEIFQLQLFDFSIGEIVEMVLDGLPDDYANIFHLAMQGFSKTEISQDLEIGREAVRYKLQRVQERLRDLVIKHRSE